MKTMMWIHILILAVTFNGFAHAAAIPVSVTRFQQEVDHLYEHYHGWTFTSYNQLKTEMERELALLNGLKVLERRDIRTIYDQEYELTNLDQATVAKRKKFIAAKYTITGAIAELGICENSSRSGVQLGGIVSLLGGPSVDLDLKNKSSVSKVRLIAQIVSVETGEIVESFESRAEVTDSSYQVQGGVMGIGGSHGTKSTVPIERAIHQAIHDLAAQIGKTLSDRN